MRKEFIGTEGLVLLDTVRRLHRRGARSALGKVLKKIHPAELAWIFRHLTSRERQDIFDLLREPEEIGTFLSELDESIKVELLSHLPTPRPENASESCSNRAGDSATGCCVATTPRIPIWARGRRSTTHRIGGASSKSCF